MAGRLAVGLFVVLVALAGCAAAPIGGQAPPTDAPTNPSAGDGAGQPTNYTGLYRETIDSVVMLRVSTSEGTVGGSGFVYDRRGYLVTNQHVVESAGSVEVRFHDGEWRTGTVVGTDVYSDLAVIHVPDPPGYATPLPLEDSKPRPGERVLALGSPFGLEGSVTAGIVSGVNRSMRTENGFSIPDTVQTDAAINPGNSGGPLVSMDGAVVGVNRARGGENVGFAISTAIVERVVPALIRSGSYAHSYVGILSVEVTPAVAQANDLDDVTGLHVVDTPTGGPAEGVLEGTDSQTLVDGQTVRTGGDVILAIDGRSITSHQDLARYLALHTRPGQTVTFTILRDGTRQDVKLTLGERPDP